MPQFAAALEEALEPDSADVDTEVDAGGEADDTTVEDTADESADADADAGAEGADEAGAEKPEKKEAAKKSDKDDDEDGGSWFAAKKPKAPAKQDQQQADGAPGKKQKAMPDTVRDRMAAEVRQQVEADYQPLTAAGISKEQLPHIAAAWRESQTNPIQFVDRQLKALANNPVTRGQLFSYFEAIGFVPKGQSGKAEEDAMPQVESYGTPEGLTPGQLQQFHKDMADWQKRQIMKEVDSRVAPIMNDRQASQHHAQAQADADAYASRTKDIQSRAGFKDNLPAIKKAYNEIQRPWRGQQNESAHPEYREERELLLEAYYSVMQEQQRAAAKKQLAADLKKKQDANAVNPQGGQGGSVQKKSAGKGFLDALKQEAARSR